MIFTIRNRRNLTIRTSNWCLETFERKFTFIPYHNWLFKVCPLRMRTYAIERVWLANSRTIDAMNMEQTTTSWTNGRRNLKQLSKTKNSVWNKNIKEMLNLRSQFVSPFFPFFSFFGKKIKNKNRQTYEINEEETVRDVKIVLFCHRNCQMCV